MNEENLKELQQSLFFELGHKVDLYHFERSREVVILKHGDEFKEENIIKILSYWGE